MGTESILRSLTAMGVGDDDDSGGGGFDGEGLEKELGLLLIEQQHWPTYEGSVASVGGGLFGGNRRFSGGIGDGRLLLSSQQQELNQEERVVDVRNSPGPGSGEWVEKGSDGLIGLPGLSFQSRKKSFADILKDDPG